MGTSTDDLKRDIEHTRSDLGQTLDAIEDRVSPTRMIERRKNRIANGIESMRHRVMGSAHDAADQIGHVPDEARRRTQGAPMMAGALAFGVGFLASRLVPTTDVERTGGAALAEKAEPLKEELLETGREVGHHLAESAKESAETIKDAASTSAHEVADHARDARDEAVEGARTTGTQPPRGY